MVDYKMSYEMSAKSAEEKIKNSFRPDGRVKFSHKETGEVSEILCESITQVGGCIVVTSHATNGGHIRFGLTHRHTGATILGNRLSADIPKLKKLARSFWRSLSPQERQVWKTSSEVPEIAEHTPQSSRRILAGG